MYDKSISNNVITNLEQKGVSIANTVLALIAQGYVINNSKRIKLDWSSILLHAFQNMDIFSEEQQKKIELLYSKIMN